MLAALGRLGCVGGVAFVAFIVGLGVADAAYTGRMPTPPVEYLPLPHRVPSSKGGIAFRFAMVHDVLHERYPRSGPAYHRERVRVTRAELAKYDPDAPVSLSLTDDLAAAHARLGEYDEAVALMRAKLARQKKLGQEGPSLYTTHANLGTFLTYGAFHEAAAGDEKARADFREGVGSLQAAIKANPMAHFGREKWQAALAEHLLAAMRGPQRLQEFDCLGNQLTTRLLDGWNRTSFSGHALYGRSYDAEYGEGSRFGEYPWLREPDIDPEEPARWEEFAPLRKHITKVGAEAGWGGVPSHQEQVPFDEPMLGLVGLWRQGGAPEAHLALAIGETMLRVGQRPLAWAAYERAARLADSFWPGEAGRKALIEHCRKRQRSLEDSFRKHGGEMPSRAEFEDELAHGESYQRAYQAYEAEKIAAGVPITEATFYDDFHKRHGPAASPVGPEEWFAHLSPAQAAAHRIRLVFPWGVSAAGAAALLTALILRRWPRPAPPVIDKPLPVIPAPEGEGRIQKAP